MEGIYYSLRKIASDRLRWAGEWVSVLVVKPHSLLHGAVVFKTSYECMSLGLNPGQAVGVQLTHLLFLSFELVDKWVSRDIWRG